MAEGGWLGVFKAPIEGHIQDPQYLKILKDVLQRGCLYTYLLSLANPRRYIYRIYLFLYRLKLNKVQKVLILFPIGLFSIALD
jgi:hypothetical protein